MNGITVKQFFATKAKSVLKGTLLGLLTSFVILLLLSGIMLWLPFQLYSVSRWINSPKNTVNDLLPSSILHHVLSNSGISFIPV